MSRADFLGFFHARPEELGPYLLDCEENDRTVSLTLEEIVDILKEDARRRRVKK